MRDKLCLNKNIYINEINLENFIRKIIPICLPVSLIENFSELYKVSSKYPKQPKLIISTKFDSNDLFKIYTANNLELGSRIIIGQHGNGSFLLPESNIHQKINFVIFITLGVQKIIKIKSHYLIQMHQE